MTKITADHLGRGAFVYIRQSTADQLLNNPESRHRQYGLADRARQLGWTTVELIDDDLGRSGGGVSRPGFERLLAAICAGRVGAVFAIEASRLARNGRDWHTLIEFCGLVGTVIVDEDGIYDPRHPNDRLLLGMKGTMSELELSLFRPRSQEALKQKARRGELFLGVAKWSGAARSRPSSQRRNAISPWVWRSPRRKPRSREWVVQRPRDRARQALGNARARRAQSQSIPPPRARCRPSTLSRSPNRIPMKKIRDTTLHKTIAAMIPPPGSGPGGPAASISMPKGTSRETKSS